MNIGDTLPVGTLTVSGNEESIFIVYKKGHTMNITSQRRFNGDTLTSSEKLMAPYPIGGKQDA